MKIITNNIHVSNQIFQGIQVLGFKIDEIFYFDESGIVFSIVEEGF